MKCAKRILTLVIAVAILVPGAVSTSWAESGIPDPATFFAGLVNPDAKGKRVKGFLTIAYDFVESPDPDCGSIFINNMFVVTTLARKANLKPFNRDFTDSAGVRPPVEPFCFDDQQQQIDFVMNLFTDEVVPFFFGPCEPGVTCPPFQIKTLKTFVSSGTGAISTEITLAVQVPRQGDDDD